MADRSDSAGDDRWRRRDVWRGLLFLFVGTLSTAYAWLAMRNGVAVGLWSGAWLAGPVLILLGANAVVRSLRAPD